MSTKQSNQKKSQAAQMAALTNSVKQLAAAAKSGNASPAKVKRGNKGAAKARAAPAAKFTDACRRVGLKDLVAHQVSWVIGNVYVGNGVLGSNDNVFFFTFGNLVTGAQSGQVPILGGDESLGATYVRDIEKYYSRKIIRKLQLRLVSLVPSTANSMMVAIGPVRGSGAAGDTVLSAGAAVTAPSLVNTLGMAGAKSFASYESGVLDLTPYIAGGSGAAQNEFTINADGESPSQWGTGAFDLVGLSPAAFVVSGSNATAGLRGTTTHYLIAEMIVDFMDFLGGNANSNPTAFALSRSDATYILRFLMTSSQKGASELPLVKDLVKYLGTDSH